MKGSLQGRVYGSSGKGVSNAKTLGSYNKSTTKKLGHSNGVIRKLGVYNGSSTGKSNLNAEMYPKY